MIQIVTRAAAALVPCILGPGFSTNNSPEAPKRIARGALSKSFEVAFVLLAGAILLVFLDSPNLGARSRPLQERSRMQNEDAAVGAGAKTKRPPVKVRVAGSSRWSGTLEISPSTITLKQGREPDIEIPVSRVDEIIYDSSSHSKSRAWLYAARDIEETPLVVGLYPVAAPLAVAAIVAPFKTRTHVVWIMWNDAESGSPMEVYLEIGKKNFAGILAELQSVTGKPWRNLPEERKKGRYASPAVAIKNLPLEQSN